MRKIVTPIIKEKNSWEDEEMSAIDTGFYHLHKLATINENNKNSRSPNITSWIKQLYHDNIGIVQIGTENSNAFSTSYWNVHILWDISHIDVILFNLVPTFIFLSLFPSIILSVISPF